MTMYQGKNRLMEIKGKAIRLYERGFISLKDLEVIMKITKKRYDELNFKR